MYAEIDSDKAVENERVLFGCFWELKNMSRNESKIRGISLHRSFLEHNLNELVVGAHYYKEYTSKNIQPLFLFHSFSPFQISANINFYNFVKELEDKEKRKGVFISTYPLGSTFTYLEDYSELKSKYEKLKLQGQYVDNSSLYQRITEDTQNWNKMLYD